MFTKTDWVAEKGSVDGGTRVGEPDILGWKVDAGTHPHRWALVCIIGFLLAALVVANLRRSRTGRRLIAVRTNERAAASLGISRVRREALRVRGGRGDRRSGRDPVRVPFVDRHLRAVQPAAVDLQRGLGRDRRPRLRRSARWCRRPTRSAGSARSSWTRCSRSASGTRSWVASSSCSWWCSTRTASPRWPATACDALRSRVRRRPAATPVLLPRPDPRPVTPETLTVEHLTVRFGGVIAVNDVQLRGPPGRGRRAHRAQRRGQDHRHRRRHRIREAQRRHDRDRRQRSEGWSATKRARRGLRRSFQSLELFEDVSVEDNIRAGADAGASLGLLAHRPRLAASPRPARDGGGRDPRVRARGAPLTVARRSSPTDGDASSASRAPWRTARR